MKRALYLIVLSCPLAVTPLGCAQEVRQADSRPWKIVFESEREGNSDIYVIDPDGSSLQRLTHTLGEKVRHWEAQWSPDRSKILFASNRHGGTFELYVMNADGSDIRRLTETPGEGRSSWSGDWSPDGKQIVFNSNRDGVAEGGRGYDIYVMAADGSDVRRLTREEGFEGTPAWSPDGKQIAFGFGPPGYPQIYVMDSDGGNVRRLTHADGLAAARPAWSPDGKKIAFMSTPHASVERDEWRDIYVMNADGSNVERLTNSPGNHFHPVWSPDGKKIAFASNRDGQHGIFVMDADGSNVKRLTSSSKWEGHTDW